jgi:chloramphenicol O-acetyltransferase type A
LNAHIDPSQHGFYLDLDSWNRREHFKYFRDFENPFFNVCADLDVTALLELCHQSDQLSFSSACLFLSLSAANEIEAFRLRIRHDRVFVLHRVNGGVTVLLDDERFTFCYFDFDEDYRRFHEQLRRSIDDVRANASPFDPRSTEDNLIHHTVLPWVSFTSVSHPRRWSRPDSIPKIAFGKYRSEAGRTLMPVSVEVHHALMDGIHVGRYMEHLQRGMAEPIVGLSLASGCIVRGADG